MQFKVFAVTLALLSGTAFAEDAAVNTAAAPAAQATAADPPFGFGGYPRPGPGYYNGPPGGYYEGPRCRRGGGMSFQSTQL